MSARAWSGSNLTGFSAVPGGVRMNTTGAFDLLSKSVWWWSSLEGSATTGGCQKIATADAGTSSTGMPKELGFALRCVHDWTL